MKSSSDLKDSRIEKQCKILLVSSANLLPVESLIQSTACLFWFYHVKPVNFSGWWQNSIILKYASCHKFSVVLVWFSKEWWHRSPAELAWELIMMWKASHTPLMKTISDRCPQLLHGSLRRFQKAKIMMASVQVIAYVGVLTMFSVT